MNPSVEDFTNTVCDPAMQPLYARVYALIKTYAIEEFEMEATDLAMTYDNYDPIDVVELYNTKIYNYLSQICQYHEIGLADEISLSSLVDICEAIDLMQNWLDHDSIMSVLETTESNVEKFAEIVFMVKTITVENGLLLVESVSDSFLKRLEELHVKEATDESEDGSSNPVLVKNLRVWKAYAKHGFIFELLEKGYPAGVSAAIYIQQVKERFAAMPASDVARELIGLLLAGEDTYNNVLQSAKPVLDMLYDELNQIVEINAQLSIQYQQFNAYLSTFNSGVV